MLNAASLNAVNQAKFSTNFVRPLYESYCFANLPRAVTYLLSGEGESGLPLEAFGNLPTRYKQVILFFVDAFGWRFFGEYADKYPLLKAFITQGAVSKLTSQFPSTTAAHVTAIHTGLDVGQSGVYEWHYYEPLVDAMISPLLFSYAEDPRPDTLQRAGLPPAQFYPQQTFYQSLQARGIQSQIFQHRAYTPSTYSDIVFEGASVSAYTDLTSALLSLGDLVRSSQGPQHPPTYYFFYYDKIDSAGHRYGPSSLQFAAAVERFWTEMEQVLYQRLAGQVGDTLLIITADHGQVEVDPGTTFYLNKQATDIIPWLQTTRAGQLRVPAGSARDMFLHIQEPHLDDALTYLRSVLAGKAEVYPTAELISQHFFGLQPPSKTFNERVGNLVILPYKHESVWWYDPGNHFEMRFHGHHGGLTPEEMEIPLLLLPL